MAQTNYDETKVPAYQLPELMVSKAGEKITTAEAWKLQRRPEVLSLFEQEVYGKVPDTKLEMTFKVTQVDEQALNGQGIRKEVVVTFSQGQDKLDINILIYLPKDKGPVPLFVGLNFNGNHTIHADPGISITNNYVRNNENYGINNNRATEASRGSSARRWAVEEIVARGYGIATVYCGDIDPDFDDDFKNGINRVMDSPDQERTGHSWGSIGAWAWGLSRTLDYFEQDAAIDHEKVIVFGHSRLGKTALWAGAQDERFALVISNDSGCGGAALSRRRFGEKIGDINGNFPHWFCRNFRDYNDNEDKLPVDQHMLLALMAPRPVYVASAEEDPWADPKGEYLSLYHAGPVYKLFGAKTLDSGQQPGIDQPVLADLQGYHIRSGKHDVTKYDWEQYLNFADRHLK